MDTPFGRFLWRASLSLSLSLSLSGALTLRSSAHRPPTPIPLSASNQRLRRRRRFPEGDVGSPLDGDPLFFLPPCPDCLFLFRNSVANAETSGVDP